MRRLQTRFQIQITQVILPRILVFIGLSLLSSGCGDKEEFRTIQGLQEKIQVLQNELDLCNERNKILQSDQEDRTSELKDSYERELAQSRKKINELTVELGQKSELLIGYEEVFNSMKFSEVAVDSNWRMATFVCFGFIVVLGFVVIFLMSKLRATDHQDRKLILKAVARLRREKETHD